MSLPGKLEVIRFEFRRDTVIVAGIGNDSHVLEILRRGADHRGSANVDVLDDFFESDTAAPRHFFKRIEVHDDHIDRGYLVLGKRRHVFLVGPNRQDSPRDLRVERLHASVQHLGKPG